MRAKNFILTPFKNIGPGAFITAAFIGPGTVTACTLAGAEYGYTLIWALIFATFATIILQDMSARLGLVTGKGLGENLNQSFAKSLLRLPLFLLIIIALFIGNSAYEAGNLAGAALGMSAIAGESHHIYATSIITVAILSGLLLWQGHYKRIEKVLITLVIIMALSFIATFITVKPDLGQLLSAALRPKVPDASLMTVMALIGTTIVPYNLFLHASAVKDRWSDISQLKAMRIDTAVSIGLGGLITVIILSTSAASLFSQNLTVENAAHMAQQLEPIFGSFAKYMLGLGFFAAGLSSSLTAPLATAYVVTEIFNIKGGTRSFGFRFIALTVIMIGVIIALTGIKPVKIIVSAQFANGLLLPIIALFLLYVMNKTDLLGAYTNSKAANILGSFVVIITFLLGIRAVLSALGFL